jgi:hypothetical protein
MVSDIWISLAAVAAYAVFSTAAGDRQSNAASASAPRRPVNDDGQREYR